MASASPDLAAPRINEKAAREYFATLHEQAAGQAGKFVIATFGQNPATGKNLKPRTAHFAIGDFDAMAAFAVECSRDPHRNVYCPPALMRPDLKTGMKGGESDVIAVLGIVADFDAKDDRPDAKAADWDTRMRAAGFEPTMVLQTSTDPAPSYQCFAMFDRPVDPRQAKRLAEALAEKTRCDHGTRDVSHVWRVPGLLNWPNQKKLAAGRPAGPQTVRTILPYDKTRLVNPAATSADGAEDEVSVPADLASPDIDGLRIPDRLKHVARTGIDPDDPEKYGSGKDRSAALFAILMSMAVNRHSDAEMLALCLLSNSPISEHVNEQGNPKKYAARQVAQARAKVAGGELARMNKNHAVVIEEGQTRVMNFGYDFSLERATMTRSSFRDFKDRYSNRSIIIKGKSKPLAEWWLGHAQRRQYDGVVFAPGKDTKGQLNLWQGMGRESVQGDWSLMREHIREIICGGSDELYTYVIGWMARCVQQPGRPGEVAIVLRGGQGTGKGFFAREFGQLFGAHFFHFASGGLLTGRFNAHLESTVLLFSDEALWGGERKGAGILKALLTEPTIAIEAKFKNPRSGKNCIHVLMATNSDWAVPVDVDDRRFLVLDVDPKRAKDLDYFGALQRQMDAGGREAMLYDLQRQDLTGFEVRTVPKTEALREQKLLGLQSHEKWWYAKLADGILLPAKSQECWLTQQEKALLYDDYVAFCQKAGQGRRSVETEMALFLRKMLPAPYPTKCTVLSDKFDEKGEKATIRVAAYEFPRLDVCRAAWDERTGQPAIWDEENDAPTLPDDARTGIAPDDPDYEIPF